MNDLLKALHKGYRLHHEDFGYVWWEDGWLHISKERPTKGDRVATTGVYSILGPLIHDTENWSVVITSGWYWVRYKNDTNPNGATRFIRYYNGSDWYAHPSCQGHTIVGLEVLSGPIDFEEDS